MGLEAPKPRPGCKLGIQVKVCRHMGGDTANMEAQHDDTEINSAMCMPTCWRSAVIADRVGTSS